MKETFEGKRVVVTGGGSGIGRAIALDLGRRGARIAIVDIDAQAAERAAAEARNFGVDARAFAADVSSRSDVDALVARVGAIDVLINNAGVSVVAPFTDTKLEDWEWALGVNLFGALHLTRAFLPSMIARGSGTIVFIASMAGLVGAPGMVAYSTTKFAVVGFAESLRLELHDKGIDVTVVCPGYVRTNLHRATRYADDRFRRFLDDPPSWYGLTSADVARAVADAIRDRKKLVVLGPERIAWWLKRIAPDAASAITRWVARRTVHARER